MKRKLLINPKAGNVDIRRLLPELESLFKIQSGSFDYVLTKSRIDTILQTRLALHAGYEHIISVGGDGTLNSVVNGFFEKGSCINPDAVLGTTNFGSGCDYFHAVAKNRDWKEFVTEFSPKKVDLGKIEFLEQDLEPVYFINMASVGMSAWVVKESGKIGLKIPALFKYAWAVLKTLPAFKPEVIKIKMGDKTVEGDFLNLFFAKGKTAGGGMKLGGNVSFDDGVFDVTLVKGMALSAGLIRFPKLFSGKFEGDPNFNKLKASTIEVHSINPLPVEFDGEVWGETDIRISLVPKIIRVAFPKV